jgi:hypothetical protein
VFDALELPTPTNPVQLESAANTKVAQPPRVFYSAPLDRLSGILPSKKHVLQNPEFLGDLPPHSSQEDNRKAEAKEGINLVPQSSYCPVFLRGETVASPGYSMREFPPNLNLAGCYTGQRDEGRHPGP